MEIETKSTRPSYNSTYFKLDENNCIEIPSPNFYVYYNWGFSTGGEYTVKFAVESIEKISSTTNEGVYLDNINGSGLDNAPEITDITDIKLDFDNLDDSLDVENDSVMWKYTNFSENAFVVTNSKIAESTINITKIWIDENNKYYTRPSSLDITVYQNENVYKVLTLTNANADISDPNTWKVSLSVPMYDDNGNEYVYTIKESEENLSLEYYYYEPYYEQELLTVTNKGNWLPPVKAEDDPIYTITITKEIVNKNNEIASAEDFLKLKLNIDDTYNFPIVLKQLNRSVSKGETSMIESYNGYSGNIYNGIVTNKGDLIFSKIPAGKYEISESFVQYFEFIGMEEIGIADIIDYDGAS